MANNSNLSIRDTKSLFFWLLAYWTWKNDSRPSVLPEILGVLDLDEVIRFTTIFGGRTVRIPNWEELASELKEAIAAYLHKCEGCTHEYIRDQIFGISQKKYRKMQKRIDDWGEHFDSFLAEREQENG